jgi:hypothetical protein
MEQRNVNKKKEASTKYQAAKAKRAATRLEDAAQNEKDKESFMTCHVSDPPCPCVEADPGTTCKWAGKKLCNTYGLVKARRCGTKARKAARDADPTQLILDTPSTKKAAGKHVEDAGGNSSDTEDEAPDSSSEEENPNDEGESGSDEESGSDSSDDEDTRANKPRWFYCPRGCPCCGGHCRRPK